MRVAIFLCFIGNITLAHPGIGIVEDSHGNIFYTDLFRVWKVTPEGQRSVAVPNVHTHELYLDDNDNLFGEHLWYNGETLDTWGHFAWKLSNNGKFQKVIPDSEGFLKDFSFVRDHFGRMYSADRSDKCQHVVRMNKDKTKTRFGDQCFENVRWMTSTDNGIVYLIDNQDLKKIDLTGRVVKMMKATNDYPGGPTTDSENNIYIADYSGKKVTRIDAAGVRSVVFETAFPWGPMSLIVASNGDYIVLESSATNTVRVERLTKAGKTTVY